MEEPALHRRLGLAGASVTNMLVMIGVGPFLTIPLLLLSMRGPQAMWGWVLGAVISVADGLVWAELGGGALPHAGGGYRYPLEAYGPHGSGRLVSSDFIARFQGRRAAEVMTLLVLVSAFASVFGGMLGLSRVPFAAARDGRFFRAFARLHPTAEFPTFAVAYVGLASAACCLLDLEQAIKATTVITSLVAAIPAVFAPTLLRRRGVALPFRMWLYPLPSFVALAGWTYIVSANGWPYLAVAAAALAAGVAAYLWRARRAGGWPWERATVEAIPRAEEAR